MSDQDTHTPLDDELLSAYLDDELTPAERARVEERLATDPAARQLLDGLRAVSRAVQDLPRETVGEDLRQAILQRAQVASAAAGAGTGRTAPQPTPGEPAWPVPQLSVGRTVRGWVWAGLAVAAALLIMVLRPGTKEADMPGTVAMRSEHGSFERDRPLDLRTRGETVTRDAERAVASSGRVRGGGGGLGGGDLGSAAAPETSGQTLGAPLASSDAPVVGSVVRRNANAEDDLALSAPANGRYAVGRRAGEERAKELRESPAEPPSAQPPATADEDELVVVHVQVTPVAFQNKSFDGLLARNGIELAESPATNEQPAQGADKSLTQEELSRLKDKVPLLESAPQRDVVLVDAPAAQIFSCMTELDKDTENYLAVDVEEAPPQSNTNATRETQADQWKQYNRGRVPTEQKLLVNRGAVNQPGEKGGTYFNFDSYQGGDLPQLSAARQMAKSYDQKARAMRVQMAPQAANRPALGYGFANTDSVSSGISGAVPAAAADKSEPSDELKRKLAENAENVQVLFVMVCPDAPPTPSPGAENRAE